MHAPINKITQPAPTTTPVTTVAPKLIVVKGTEVLPQAIIPADTVKPAPTRRVVVALIEYLNNYF